MTKNKTQDEELPEKINLRYYLSQKLRLLPLLIGSFILIDITVLFLSANYTFTEIFYLCGIVMILLAIGSSIIILIEGSPIWSFVSAIVFGLIPIIEIIIHISMVPQDTISLILALLTIFLALVMICFLLLFIPFYQKKNEAKAAEG